MAGCNALAEEAEDEDVDWHRHPRWWKHSLRKLSGTVTTESYIPKAVHSPDHHTRTGCLGGGGAERKTADTRSVVSAYRGPVYE